MIILEGPDGSGKTTLAKSLAKELGGDYRRAPQRLLSSDHGPVGEQLVDWWLGELAFYHNLDTRFLVYDRATAISEPIYGAVLNRDPICNPQTIAYMLSLFKRHNAIIIFCLPPYEEVEKNQDNQLKGMTPRRQKLIYWQYQVAYTHFAMQDRIHTFKYSWRNRQGIVNQVKELVGGTNK